MTDNIIPEGGAKLIGYNVEYWCTTTDKHFLAEGVIIGFKKKKNGKFKPIGIYKIRVGDKTYNMKRSQFTVIPKSELYTLSGTQP